MRPSSNHTRSPGRTCDEHLRQSARDGRRSHDATLDIQPGRPAQRLPSEDQHVTLVQPQCILNCGDGDHRGAPAGRFRRSALEFQGCPGRDVCGLPAFGPTIRPLCLAHGQRAAGSSRIGQLDSVTLRQPLQPAGFHLKPAACFRRAVGSGLQADAGGSEYAAELIALWAPLDHCGSGFNGPGAQLRAGDIEQNGAGTLQLVAARARMLATIAAHTDASSCAQLMRAQSIPPASMLRTSP